MEDEGLGKGTYLEATDEIVMDFVLEEGAALVVIASPSPHVLPVTVGFTCVEDDGSHDPHDGAEDEEADSEGGVVDSGFLCPVMTASPV